MRDAERATSASSILLYEYENGAVRASLRFLRIRAARIEFALDVVNATSEPLLATMYALARNVSEIPLPPYSLWVGARSEAYVDLPLSWVAALTCRAISVRLQGRNVHQRLEAAMPKPSSLGWFLAGALLVAMIAGTLSLAHPRVDRLDVPASAIAGTSFDVGYATAAATARGWRLDDLGGTRIAGGRLDGSAGRVTIEAPKVGSQSVFDVRISASNLLGEASAVRPVVIVTPRPVAASPRIIAFSLDRAVVDDGGSIVARYRVSADSGDLVAVDAQGGIVAQAATGPTGLTTLRLPIFGRDRELQIRLVVRRGPQLATSGIGVQVVATPASR